MIEPDEPAGLERRMQGSGTDSRPRPVELDDDGHTEFVTGLFERHSDSLTRYAVSLLRRHAEAEEVVQETFLRLLNSPNLERTEHRARAYMFRIATNLAHDRFRERSQHGPGAEEFDPETMAGDETPELLADMAESLDIIERTLLDLKPRRRRVFLLRVSDGLGYDAIASVLGVSRRTVEREMRYVLDMFERRLRGSGR